MLDAIVDVFKWAKEDYKEFRVRFILEVVAWMGSIGCAIVMAITLPHPPFIFLYPIFMMQCAIFGWVSYTRKSFGMMCNALLLVSIDITAYTRLLLQ